MSHESEVESASSRLGALATEFTSIAHEVESFEQRPSSIGIGFDQNVRSDRLWRRRCRSLQEKYRGLVATAGTLMIDIDRRALVEDTELHDLVAAHELGDWSGLVVDPANLFAMFVGGQSIELRSNAGYRTYETQGEASWDISPSSPKVPAARLEQIRAESSGNLATLSPLQQFEQVLTSDASAIPDHDQCLRYARCCELMIKPVSEAESRQNASMPSTLPPTAKSQSDRIRGRDANGTSKHPASKPERGTPRGGAEPKIIAALTLYHQYANGSVLTTEPIGNNELARLAKVDKSTVAKFLDRKFNNGSRGGLARYRNACQDTGTLIAALKMLNSEYTPSLLTGRLPREEHRDDEE